MIPDSNIKVRLTKTNDVIIKVAAIVGAVTIIAGGYTWYLNNIWKPHIEVLSVDFENGTAQLKHKSKIIQLDGDAIYWINADWGLRLGVFSRFFRIVFPIQKTMQ